MKNKLPNLYDVFTGIYITTFIIKRFYIWERVAVYFNRNLEMDLVFLVIEVFCNLAAMLVGVSGNHEFKNGIPIKKEHQKITHVLLGMMLVSFSIFEYMIH